MIKIRHINGDEKFVTVGAYEGFFKPLGYKPIVEKEIKEEKIKVTGEEEKVEKPIDKPKSFGENKDKRK